MNLREGSPLTDLTLEEEVLAALVTADEALQEALGVYDNLERLAIERKTEELSQRFVSKVSRMSIVSALQELIIYKRFRDQDRDFHDTHEEVQSDIVGASSTLSRNNSLSGQSTPNAGSSTFTPSASPPTHIPQSPGSERAEQPTIAPDLPYPGPGTLQRRREYVAPHKRKSLEPDTGGDPLVAMEGMAETSSGPRLSAKASGKRRAHEGESSHGEGPCVYNAAHS
jgi:hypothetical protein